MRFPSQVLLIGLIALVTLLCLPLVLHRGETNYTWDESNYYLPAIAQIRATWPALDLQRDSLSATPPGYPYLLAGISLVSGQDLVTMRFVNLAISLSVLALLWNAGDRSADGLARFAALAPLAFSNFYIKSASNVVTDNPALLAVSATIILALAASRGASLPWACATATAAVFFRQNTFWLEAPLGVRALFSRRLRDAACLLPPLLLLAILVLSWGGLVPPAWRTETRGEIVFAAGAYHLALLALLSPFYYVAILPDWRHIGRVSWAWWGALAGLAMALAGPTNPSHEAGRWGGYLWEVAARLPVVGERSLLFVLLAPAGGFMLGLLAWELVQRVGNERGLAWLGAQVGFLAVGLANRQVFHRYFEPTQLVLLILWLLLLIPAAPDRRPRCAPLLLLAAGQAALTLVTAHGRTFGYL